MLEIFRKLVGFVINVHANYPKKPSKAYRYWDRKTPYSIHPLWCLTTLLTEETLPEKTRFVMAQVLAMHDIREDTTQQLPGWIDDEAADIIAEMEYRDTAQEMEEIWQKSDLAKLGKLYDKISNLLDSSWMFKRKGYGYEYFRSRLIYIIKLTSFVEERFGKLNIVWIARAVIESKQEFLIEKAKGD